MKQKGSILIVDDDGSIGRSLALIFNKKGYEAETAVTAQEGLERALERFFNIALIDIQLPDMSGTELLKKLKDINPKIPCMIITGHASVENAVRALELGASAYITKPLDMDDVLNRIKEALEKQKLEQKLVESEERYRNLYENAPDMYISVSPETGHIIRCNEAVIRNTGYTKEEIIGRPVLEMYHPDCLEKAKQTFQQFVTTGEVRDVELQVRRKDGSRLEVSLSVSALRDTAGKIIHSYSSWRDITERKKATEEIEKLAKFPAENPNPVLRISKDGTLLYHNYASESLLRHWHYKEGKPLQDRWFQFVLDALRDDDIKTAEAEMGDKVISLTFAPIVNQGFVNVYGLDITERKQAEYKIKHLNLTLRAIRNVNQLIGREKNRTILIQEACDILTGVRGYSFVWLGLLKDQKSFATVVGAPINTDFFPFFEQVLRGDHPPCIKKALTMKDQFLFMDRSRDCGDCSLKKLHLGGNSLLIRIAHESKLFGFLVLSFESDIYMDQEEKELLEEVCGDIAFGLYNIELGEHLEKRTDDLKERVKELKCLYEITTLVEKPGISLEALIEGIVNLIPSAWQYPEATCAKIIFGAKEYKTENFKETIWKLSTDIMVDEKLTGSIAVCYLEEKPRIDKGPFQKEEISLIKNIAERLGKTIEKEQGKIDLQQSYQRIKKALDTTIETMSKIVEAKDPYTAGHQQRVSQLSAAIAKELNFSEDLVEGIRIASLIHDIGKIGLPTEILSKPSKLTDIELSLIKNHSQIGYDILKSIDFFYPVANIVLQHHERLNGSGYPNNLKGDEILLGAKIIGIADVIEAMSSHRPYRPALGIDAALEEISKKKGILYDPEVVEACLKLFKEKEFKFES